MKKLPNQGATVETAVRHSGGAPAEGTSVQSKEDKSRPGSRQGYFVEFSSDFEIDDRRPC